MGKSLLLASSAMLLSVFPLTAQDTKPKHINKALELLEQGQPVYYIAAGGGFEEGKKAAQTAADYINYELEHGAFDMTALRQFMLGLVAGGPTKSGHRTPAVIVTLPIHGDDAASMRANAWMIQQTLACGVHGILMVHSSSPDAVREFIRATRYPFAPPAPGIEEGTRGSGSQSFAARIWGISQTDYLRRADPWPLNPDGELMLGVKIEDRHALAHAEETTRISGLAFAEWGPGDMGFSLLGLPGPGRGGGGRLQEPQMVAARRRVLEATKAAHIFFLNECNANTVLDQLKDGTMICTGGDSRAATIGREYTKRPQPW